MSPHGDERAFPVYTFFVHDWDFFPGSLVSRAIKLQGSLPAIHLMTSGRVSINKKEMKFLFFYIFFFSSHCHRVLSEHFEMPEELPLLKYIFD